MDALLKLEDSFAPQLAAASIAAGVLATKLALASATWEPHDWSDFA